MSIESEIKKLTAALEALTAALGQRPAADDQPLINPAPTEEVVDLQPEPAPVKAEAVKPTPLKEEPAPVVEPEPTSYTLDEIRKRIVAFTKVHGRDIGIATLKKSGGVEKLGELDEVDYPAVWEAFALTEEAA